MLLCSALFAPQTRLVTDKWTSYQNLPISSTTRSPLARWRHVALPWIHRLFSNLKRWDLGVYYGVRKTNLQHYLDEFVFASTGGAHAMPPSILCSASPPAPPRRPTTS
jgi:hypothetical protein